MSGGKYPMLFVGCATEDLSYAEAVQAKLEHTVEAEIWTEGTFVPSGHAVTSLLSTAARADFALLIGTGIDTLSSRGSITPAMRENVLFELALFLGAVGPERVFVLLDRATLPILPSDLDGFTPLTFDSGKVNPMAAVGTACTEMKKIIFGLGIRGVRSV